MSKYPKAGRHQEENLFSMSVSSYNNNNYYYYNLLYIAPYAELQRRC